MGKIRGFPLLIRQQCYLLCCSFLGFYKNFLNNYHVLKGRGGGGYRYGPGASLTD